MEKTFRGSRILDFKTWAKKIYRKTFYSFLKRLEYRFRQLLFPLLKILFPKFHSFRLLGLPYGVTQISAKEVVPPLSFQRLFPFELEHERYKKAFSPLQIHLPAQRATMIPRGFATSTAAHLTAEGRLIPAFTEQFTMQKAYQHKLFTFRRSRCFSSIPHIKGTTLSLAVDGQSNYYHWLFDALPKIYLARQASLQPDYLYADFSQHFQRSSLEKLGFTEKQIIKTAEHATISAEQLILTSFPALSGIAPWVCDFLRASFLTPTSKGAKRLYISRSRAKHRHILNEDILAQWLKEEGFTTVYLEDLSFDSQIELFQQAEWIIAPHGAGLSNLVFSSDATVIELFPPRFPCNCYWNLSQVRGLRYAAFIGEDLPHTYSSLNEGYDDIVLDVEKLKKLYSRII